MNDVKTIKAYEQYADKFIQTTKNIENYGVWFQRDRELFVHQTNKGKILDLGCGSGRDANFFRSKGFSVVCLDITKQFVKYTVRQGLPSVLMDLHYLGFKSKSFQGIWCTAVLHHFQKKEMPKILKSIDDILAPNGNVFLDVKFGEGEKFEEGKQYPEVKRWVARYTKQEFTKLVQQYFVPYEFSFDQESHDTFICWHARKC